MEDQTVKIAGPSMHDKVFDRFRCDFRKQAQVDVAHVGVHDSKLGCTAAFSGRRSDTSERLFFPCRLLVEYVSIKAFRVRVTVSVLALAFTTKLKTHLSGSSLENM